MSVDKYLAGLFDGEGCVTYSNPLKLRKGKKKAYPTWNIRLEIAMTDRSILVWLNEILGVGTVGEKKYKSRYALGWKKQWRWRCSHRDAFYVSCVMWPFAHVKLDKLQKIIDHYKDYKIMNDKVVNLDEYKQLMGLE